MASRPLRRCVRQAVVDVDRSDMSDDGEQRAPAQNTAAARRQRADEDHTQPRQRRRHAEDPDYVPSAGLDPMCIDPMPPTPPAEAPAETDARATGNLSDEERATLRQQRDDADDTVLLLGDEVATLRQRAGSSAPAARLLAKRVEELTEAQQERDQLNMLLTPLPSAEETRLAQGFVDTLTELLADRYALGPDGTEDGLSGLPAPLTEPGDGGFQDHIETTLAYMTSEGSTLRPDLRDFAQRLSLVREGRHGFLPVTNERGDSELGRPDFRMTGFACNDSESSGTLNKGTLEAKMGPVTSGGNSANDRHRAQLQAISWIDAGRAEMVFAIVYKDPGTAAQVKESLMGAMSASSPLRRVLNRRLFVSVVHENFAPRPNTISASTDERLRADAQQAHQRRQAHFAQTEGVALVPSAHAPYIYQMSDTQYSSLRTALEAHLQRTRRKLWDKCQRILSVQELVDDIFLAFKNNRHVVDGANEIVHETYMLPINGDVQRGKSKVEALKAAIGFYINSTPRCRDRCCTLLCTPMIAWVKNLYTSVERDITANVVHDEDVVRQEVESINQELNDEDHPPTGQGNGNQHERLHVAFYAPRSGGDTMDKVLTTMWSGGLLIFARTGPQIKAMAEVLRAEINHPIGGSNERPLWPIVMLDEGDRMLGRCAELNQQRSNANVYERALNDLLGWELQSAGPGGLPTQRIRPPIVCSISATNALFFAWMLLRAGETRRHGSTEAERRRPLFRILDVLAFFPDDEGREYFGFKQFRRFGCVEEGGMMTEEGELLGPLLKQDWYVNSQVVSLYEEVLRTPHACLLDCTTSGIQWQYSTTDTEPTDLYSLAAAFLSKLTLSSFDPTALFTCRATCPRRSGRFMTRQRSRGACPFRTVRSQLSSMARILRSTGRWAFASPTRPM